MLEKNISPFSFVIGMLVALGMILSMSVLLPHDSYHRYQSYDSVTTQKTDWIYERLHFDPAPIDVVLIGTSRMGGGLSAPLIEQYFCAATGNHIQIANFSVPELGRNMHYAIAQEATGTKAPELIVVELNEIESRKPHNGFVAIASAKDILTAPIAININYFSDIIRLPGRQAQLFFSALVNSYHLRKAFDPEAYPGRHLDRTQILDQIDGTVISRDFTLPQAQLEALTERRLAMQKPIYILPKPLRALEYRFSKHYLEKIRRSVKDIGATTDFVYLPAYKSPEKLPPALSESLGLRMPPITIGEHTRTNPDMWIDATHVNANGARLQSLNFAQKLAGKYPGLGTPTSTCSMIK